jgi:hypothetical protein
MRGVIGLVALTLILVGVGGLVSWYWTASFGYAIKLNALAI